MRLRLVTIPSILLSAAACVQVGAYPDFMIEPSEPISTDELRAIFPDNDAVLVSEGGDITLQWHRDGEPVAELADSLTVPSEQTSAGETWMLSVQRIGNRDAFRDISIADEVDILNARPSATSLQLTPDPAFTTDVLTAEFELEDADEDLGVPNTVWSVNSTEVDAPGRVLGSSEFVKGDVVTFTVTPVDTAGEGEPVSTTLTIQNSPGTYRSARIEPSGPAPQNAVLTCTPEGWADADSDIEGAQYVWERDGVQVGTEQTFAVSGSPEDSRIRCGATPDDGEDVGATVFSPEVIVIDPDPEQ